MKQTAVEWLIEQWPILESQLPPQLIEKAKEMEKEQIMDAVQFYTVQWIDAEQYYNEQYGK